MKIRFKNGKVEYFKLEKDEKYKFFKLFKIGFKYSSIKLKYKKIFNSIKTLELKGELNEFDKFFSVINTIIKNNI